MRNYFSLGDWDRRGNSHPFGYMTNKKPDKPLQSSSFTYSKKAFAVIKEDGENQTQITENTCPNDKAISNVGGPGTLNGSGLDKKHGSYDRYLARKVGWVLKRQHC
jgi:hypothetical protein